MARNEATQARSPGLGILGNEVARTPIRSDGERCSQFVQHALGAEHSASGNALAKPDASPSGAEATQSPVVAFTQVLEAAQGGEVCPRVLHPFASSKADPVAE